MSAAGAPAAGEAAAGAVAAGAATKGMLTMLTPGSTPLRGPPKRGARSGSKLTSHGLGSCGRSRRCRVAYAAAVAASSPLLSS